ncbi:hypothetical protein ACOMCU_01225 [Lysinibacillus sp. UGB7]|uniref:hypothetical protein n=1 Tax=Lysinibacillus sp. UGB7 TaxID=3411039 RepID=UPI003B79A26B
MMNKREKLIQRNKKFVQIPMPDLSEMTDGELERRADFWEKSFEIAFKEDDCEVEDI